MSKQIPLLCCLLLSALLYRAGGLFDAPKPALGATATTTLRIPVWQHLSTVSSDLPTPSRSTQQTASLVVDLNRDGLNDFVIAARRNPGPSLVWYQRRTDGWDKQVIEPTALDIEAGGAAHDIDNDGDLDLVFAGDNRSNQLWWWENPYPLYPESGGWTRRLIKDGGARKHHDQIFGDFDGDGQAEFVFWNQHASALLLAEIPTDPHQATPWPTTAIYEYDGLEHEGLAKADIDGDGVLDIIGGGRWFKYSDGGYVAKVVDDSQRFSRAAVGQLIPGGRPEIVFVCGDCVGPARWYEWTSDSWVSHDLLTTNVDHGHTLEIGDVNADGRLDIFVAEMRVNGENADAATWLFLGDGAGNFLAHQMTTGFGHHESRLADLDGDGDLDILGKPYNWETPRLDIWLNQTDCAAESPPDLTQWRRHVIDDARPWRALFVTTADVNQDGFQDILTGGWWYANPGTPAGAWQRHLIGNGLNNLATVADFDDDGAVDILGTAGRGSSRNASLLWAQNDGQGNFTIHDNISAGDGDFLQGVALVPGTVDSPSTIALSWHDETKALQQLTIPADPVGQPWPIQLLSNTTQGEELSVGDIDRDGDPDLMLGTQWLRNENGRSWTPFTLAPATVPASAKPDRNRLVDLNGDGRLDVVVGFEGISEAAQLTWYAQPIDPAQSWTEQIIDEPIGPMSLDVRDMDGDGDWDIIVGEHNTKRPTEAGLYIYENRDGRGGEWQRHLVYRGDEHHDGAQTVDIDNDGDSDILSIGWGHDDVVLYENRAVSCQVKEPTPTPTAVVLSTQTTTSTPISSPTHTPTSTPTTVPEERTTPDAPTRTVTATPSATQTAAGTATPTKTPTPTQENLPIIKRHPIDHSTYLGGDVTFGIDVIGTGTFTYQWYRDAEPIQNAHQSTYTLVGVTPADDGVFFSCVVSNAVGSVQSQSARLQVLTEPSEEMTHRAYLPYIVTTH